MGDRSKAAAIQNRRIARLPISYAATAALILMHAIAGGLYGSEVKPLDESCLSAFRSSILDAIMPRTTLRSADMGFSLNSYGQDLDPDA